LYQSQKPVIERAVEAAALGSVRSRGYCLEMICADFLAVANLDNGDPEMLLCSMTRFFKFLPGEQRQAFLGGLGAEGVMNSRAWKSRACDWRPDDMSSLRLCLGCFAGYAFFTADDRKSCCYLNGGSRQNLHPHHRRSPSNGRPPVLG